MYYIQIPGSERPLEIPTIRGVRIAAYRYFKGGRPGVWIIEGQGETVLAFSKENRVFVGEYEVVNEKGTIKKSS